jgi:hypothetical protein
MEIALSRGRIAGVGTLVVACVLVFVVTGYAIGLFTIFGYADRTEKWESGGFRTDGGMSIGLKQMYFVEGQTFFAEYDAKIREGRLRIGILKTFATRPGPHQVHVVSSNGPGEMSYQIPETGFYSVYFTGSPSGNGYDISYSVHWGMR